MISILHLKTDARFMILTKHQLNKDKVHNFKHANTNFGELKFFFMIFSFVNRVSLMGRTERTFALCATGKKKTKREAMDNF